MVSVALWTSPPLCLLKTFLTVRKLASNSSLLLSWIIGVCVGYIWQRSTEGDIDFRKFFGFLSFKYKETGSNVIGHIDAISV